MSDKSDVARRGEGIGRAKTALFRKQHAEILDTLRVLSPLVGSPRTVLAQPAAIRRSLLILGAQLSVHLSMEDNGLYPQLRSRGSADVVKLTQDYENEMGDLKAAFSAYSARWLTGDAISDNAPVFVKETTALVQAITNRIAREDNELYPLVDQLK